MKQEIKNLYKNILIPAHKAKIYQNNSKIIINRIYGTWRKAHIQYLIQKDIIEKTDITLYEIK